MDRDQSGTLTLRLLTGQPAEMHALQRVLEAAPSYYLTVTGFPFKSGASLVAADHFHGPLPLFREAGFGAIGENKHLTVMRKLLSAPA